LRVLSDVGRPVRDERHGRGVSAAILTGAARVSVLLPMEDQEREGLLIVLDVADAADRAADLAAGGDAVAEAEGADGAHHRVEQQVAELLPPLVDAAEDRKREL